MQQAVAQWQGMLVRQAGRPVGPKVTWPVGGRQSWLLPSHMVVVAMCSSAVGR